MRVLRAIAERQEFESAMSRGRLREAGRLAVSSRHYERTNRVIVAAINSKDHVLAIQVAERARMARIRIAPKIGDMVDTLNRIEETKGLDARNDEHIRELQDGVKRLKRTIEIARAAVESRP